MCKTISSLILSCAYTWLVLHCYSGLGAIKPNHAPWYRLEGLANNLKINKRNSHIAYTDHLGRNLQILDTKNGNIFLITKHLVGASFFWEPNGFRLFYRELIRNDKNTMQSLVKVFDVSIHKEIKIAEIPSSSGLLTFDPRDMKFQLLHDKGIFTRRIVFPDARPARWQSTVHPDKGKWLATEKGILWLTQSGFTITKMQDDGSDVTAFDISSDGTSIAWSTRKGNVWVSQEGNTPRNMGAGQEPAWHPHKLMLIYAAARKVGNKVVNYDLRIVDDRGVGRYVTNTQYSSERWPSWSSDGHAIVYTLDKTTDLMRLDLEK